MTTATELTAALPESQRDEGERLIAQRILPPALAEAPDRPGFGERVYARVANRLATTAPEQRLPELRALAAEVEIEDHSRAALALAIARFLHDGHPLSPAARGWINPEIERLRNQPLQDTAQEAATREARLDEWQHRVQAEHPTVWTGHQTRALHARFALASAQTGSYETSCGSVYDFLVDAGAATQHFDVF